MKKLLLVYLLLCPIFHFTVAQQYDLKEKESLKSFFRQSSGLDGKLNLQRLGLSISDTITWNTSDDWIGQLKGITFYRDQNTRIDHIASVVWSNMSLEGSFYCSDFMYLSKVDLYGNQLDKLIFTKCPSLSYLNCGDNNLVELRLGECDQLRILHFDHNLLTSIDLSSAQRLTRLYCPYNKLVDLNLSACQNLQYLNCSFNKLAQLDLSTNDVLVYLHAQGNQLKELDVLNKSVLNTLICDANQLTELNLSGSNNIETLSCADNQLSELLFTDCKQLFYMSCYNNRLSSLDLSSATNQDYLYCQNNQITNLLIGKNVTLENGNCKDNQLLYSQLSPILASNPYQIEYNSQSIVNGGEMQSIDSINLTTEYSQRNYITTYQWTDENNSIINLRSNGQGTFYIEKEHEDQTLLCTMTNSGFSGLRSQYQVKVKPSESEKIQFTDHLFISGYKNRIASGEPFELHLPVSGNKEEVKLGLYTYAGSYLCDLNVEQILDSVFICTIPKVGNGVCIIQPYIFNQDSIREIITRPDKSHLIDKLPVTVYLPSGTRTVNYEISQTASTSRHMQLILSNTSYLKVKQNEEFKIYIPAGQKTTSIGIFSMAGLFLTDIVKSSYGDTYTCVISNPNIIGDFIVMPYRIEDGMVKVIEREFGAELVDRMPLYVESNTLQQRNTSVEEQAITICLNDMTNTLYVKGLAEEASCQIYNLSGALIVKCQIIDNQVDAQILASGIYVVKVITQSGKTIVSKVKKK